MKLHLKSIFVIFMLNIFVGNSQTSHAENRRDSQSSETQLSDTYFFYQHPEYPKDCGDVFNQCSGHNTSGVFRINPDGYPEPFEVYCSHGWTVIQRRTDGYVSFDRCWNDYKKGFGFLNGEFWLGNEKLAYLTNQKNYQLRADFESSSGVSFYISYDRFRISDEWNSYRLVSVGEYSGTANYCVTLCPSNMRYGNCSCQATFDDPHGCDDSCERGVTCRCADGFLKKGWECVPLQDCDCFVEGEGVLPVFQRRIDGDGDFFLYWNDYKQGFGSRSDEFWLGNDNLYYLTNQGQKNYELRIDLVNKRGSPYYAKYTLFRISDESDKYRLVGLGSFIGTTGYDAMAYHRDLPFTTRDRNNDDYSGNWATNAHSAWWFGDTYYSDLNADYDHDSWGIWWHSLRGGNNHLKYSEMKVRPLSNYRVLMT